MKRNTLLAALALAMPLAAQAPTESRPSAPVVKTEKLWKLEATGLGS